MNIGLGKTELKLVVEKLNIILADTYVLYTKTQGFHWNIRGIHFSTLHSFFGTLYEELLPAIDELAERIRTLGSSAPGSLEQMLSLSTLDETLEVLNEKTMLQALLVDHETMCRNIRAILEELENTVDEGTIDFLVGRLRDHEKTAWMIRGHLE